MSKSKIFNSLKHLTKLFSKRPQADDEFFDRKSFHNEVVGCASSRTDYSLEIRKYYFANPHRELTRGFVYKKGEPLIHINRMDSDFPFAWVEKHLDHRDHHFHDYLLCASTSGGYTTIQLDTLEVRDFVHEDVENGKERGFRIQEFCPSPDKLSLLLRGDHYEESKKDLVLLDFSNPMTIPYKELKKYPHFESYSGWRKHGEHYCFDVSLQREVRVRDGKPYDQLRPEEKDLIEDGFDRTEQRYETVLCYQNGSEKKIRSVLVPEGKTFTWRDFTKKIKL